MTVALNLWNAAATVLWYLLLRRHLRNVVDKQSVEVIAAFFVAGILSVVLTFTLHALNPLPWLAPFVYNVTFLYEVLVTGVIEETAKFLCFLLIAHSLTTVREPQDGVLQGAAVGLGFAFIENIVYFDRFSDLALAVRPIISTGGHMIYGAVWGGLYSAARWSNIRDTDPGAYRVALLGVAATALIHGTYNSIVIYGWLIGAVVDGIILPVVFVLFVYLEERSPYRTFPLSQAQWAVPALERGLAFNRTSPVLNTRMGLYLMRLGRYRRAAEHFSGPCREVRTGTRSGSSSVCASSPSFRSSTPRAASATLGAVSPTRNGRRSLYNWNSSWPMISNSSTRSNTS